MQNNGLVGFDQIGVGRGLDSVGNNEPQEVVILVDIFFLNVGMGPFGISSPNKSC